jgi:hypothetical protein
MVPGLGSYPQGDPETIRALAAQLRRIAATLVAVPRPVLDGWQSPAADRTRALLRSAADRASRNGDELRACAGSLDHAANQLESDQQAWLAARRRMESTS